MIREAEIVDAEHISDIYNYYIRNTIITFETEPVSTEEIASRIENFKKTGPFLVCEIDNEIIGYAYISKFADRKAYENTVQSTIYLKNGFGGRGIGSELYSELLNSIAERYHSVIAIIALPNTASIRLHEKCGFKFTGRLYEAGRKFDKWIDVGYWQKIPFYSKGL